MDHILTSPRFRIGADLRLKHRHGRSFLPAFSALELFVRLYRPIGVAFRSQEAGAVKE